MEPKRPDKDWMSCECNRATRRQRGYDTHDEGAWKMLIEMSKI